MSAPVIGVTLSGTRGRVPASLVRHLLRAAGARASLLPPGRSVDVRRLDGLVLGGGEDIDPLLYGMSSESPFSARDGRDAFEFELLRRVGECGLPVLGICRGAQMINVAAGGTLHQDVRALRPPRWRRRVLPPRLDLHVEPGSRLHRVLGTAECRVNCLHRQSVARLGNGLRCVARDEFGIVQAVEAHGPRFVLGVQWHPELLPFSSVQRRLFAALVAAARSRSRILRTTRHVLPPLVFTDANR